MLAVLPVSPENSTFDNPGIIAGRAIRAMKGMDFVYFARLTVMMRSTS
jgi:hypothetical protein